MCPGNGRSGRQHRINFRSHPEEAEATAVEVRKFGRKATLHRCDVADQAAVEGMVEDFVKEHGQIDGYVSNAAYSDREAMVTANMEGFKRTSMSRCGEPSSGSARRPST